MDEKKTLNQSPKALAWKRFRSNKLGMVSCGFVLLWALMALFAYLIIPDKTPNANRQILEISTKKPGFEAAYKLAVAYSYTGDVNREVSALLYCAEGYPQYRAPFVQLYRLYPDEAARPARVQSAIEAGLARYGSLE